MSLVFLLDYTGVIITSFAAGIVSVVNVVLGACFIGLLSLGFLALTFTDIIHTPATRSKSLGAMPGFVPFIPFNFAPVARPSLPREHSQEASYPVFPDVVSFRTDPVTSIISEPTPTSSRVPLCSPEEAPVIGVVEGSQEVTAGTLPVTEEGSQRTPEPDSAASCFARFPLVVKIVGYLAQPPNPSAIDHYAFNIRGPETFNENGRRLKWVILDGQLACHRAWNYSWTEARRELRSFAFSSRKSLQALKQMPVPNEEGTYFDYFASFPKRFCDANIRLLQNRILRDVTQLQGRRRSLLRSVNRVLNRVLSQPNTFNNPICQLGRDLLQRHSRSQEGAQRLARLMPMEVRIQGQEAFISLYSFVFPFFSERILIDHWRLILWNKTIFDEDLSAFPLWRFCAQSDHRSVQYRRQQRIYDKPMQVLQKYATDYSDYCTCYQGHLTEGLTGLRRFVRKESSLNIFPAYAMFFISVKVRTWKVSLRNLLVLIIPEFALMKAHSLRQKEALHDLEEFKRGCFRIFEFLKKYSECLFQNGLARFANFYGQTPAQILGTLTETHWSYMLEASGQRTGPFGDYPFIEKDERANLQPGRSDFSQVTRQITKSCILELLPSQRHITGEHSALSLPVIFELWWSNHLCPACDKFFENPKIRTSSSGVSF